MRYSKLSRPTARTSSSFSRPRGVVGPGPTLDQKATRTWCSAISSLCWVARQWGSRTVLHGDKRRLHGARSLRKGVSVLATLGRSTGRRCGQKALATGRLRGPSLRLRGISRADLRGKTQQEKAPGGGPGASLFSVQGVPSRWRRDGPPGIDARSTAATPATQPKLYQMPAHGRAKPEIVAPTEQDLLPPVVVHAA